MKCWRIARLNASQMSGETCAGLKEFVASKAVDDVASKTLLSNSTSSPDDVLCFGVACDTTIC